MTKKTQQAIVNGIYRKVRDLRNIHKQKFCYGCFIWPLETFYKSDFNSILIDFASIPVVLNTA